MLIRICVLATFLFVSIVQFEQISHADLTVKSVTTGSTVPMTTGNLNAGHSLAWVTHRSQTTANSMSYLTADDAKEIRTMSGITTIRFLKFSTSTQTILIPQFKSKYVSTMPNNAILLNDNGSVSNDCSDMHKEKHLLGILVHKYKISKKSGLDFLTGYVWIARGIRVPSTAPLDFQPLLGLNVTCSPGLLMDITYTFVRPETNQETNAHYQVTSLSTADISPSVFTVPITAYGNPVAPQPAAPLPIPQ